MNLFNRLVYTVFAADIIGKVDPVNTPYCSITGQCPDGGVGGGLNLLITNIIRVFFVIAGILALVNFILAGFQYMTAGGDSKQLEQAWSRIWLSLVGLVLIVGSFALAAVFGYLIFGDPLFMLQPKIYGPPPLK